MKSTSLRLIIAFILIIGTVYAVSVIATPETIILAMTLTTFMLLKFIIRATFYIVFKVLKWIVIIALIGLMLSYLL
ncbi:hypothetical protein [Petrimonas sp.]|jgi:hypothetical protein|uniref:hypothetical protein n=1 Tax=Petrimonas sp. TaxID=2023866 RepID=UPI003F5152E9